jgi:hypothetical protein
MLSWPIILENSSSPCTLHMSFQLTDHSVARCDAFLHGIVTSENPSNELLRI